MSLHNIYPIISEKYSILHNLIIQSNLIKPYKKGKILTNMKSIRVFNTIDNPLLLAKDIGFLLNVSIKQVIINYNNDNDKVVHTIKVSDKIKKIFFLTNAGIIRTIYISCSPIAKLFRHLLNYQLQNSLNFINEKLSEADVDNLYYHLLKYNKKMISERIKIDNYRQSIIKKIDNQIFVETDNSDLHGIYDGVCQKKLIQLNTEKKKIYEKLSLLCDSELEIPHNNELNLIKEIYLKPIHVYIPTPTFMCNICKYYNKSILNANNLTMEEYKNNFITIQAKLNNDEKIRTDEILYIYLRFGKKINNDQFIKIYTLRVFNRDYYTKLTRELYTTKNTIVIKNMNLCRTTIDDISTIIKQQILSYKME